MLESGGNPRDSLIAVASNAEGAGAIVYWSMRGTIEYSRFKENWERAGLPEDWFLAPTSDADALKRALDKVVGGAKSGFLIRNLGDHVYAIVEERRTNYGRDAVLEHETIFKVGLMNPVKYGPGNFQPEWGWQQSETAPELSFCVETSQVVSEDDEEMYGYYMQGIATQFKSNRDNVTVSDVSSWLVKLCSKRIQALSLRDRGGMYYIHPSKMYMWSKVATAVQDSGPQEDVPLREIADVHSTGPLTRPLFRVHSIPTMSSEGAVGAVMDGLIDEVVKRAKDIQKAIHDGQGKRGLSARSRECEALLEKLNVFDDMLGDRHRLLKSEMHGVKSKVAYATLALEAEEDQAV